MKKRVARGSVDGPETNGTSFLRYWHDTLPTMVGLLY